MSRFGLERYRIPATGLLAIVAALAGSGPACARTAAVLSAGACLVGQRSALDQEDGEDEKPAPKKPKTPPAKEKTPSDKKPTEGKTPPPRAGGPPAITGDEEEEPLPKSPPKPSKPIPATSPAPQKPGPAAPSSMPKTSPAAVEPAKPAKPVTTPPATDAESAEEEEPEEEVCDRVAWRGDRGVGGWIKAQLFLRELIVPQPSNARLEIARYPKGTQVLAGGQIVAVEYYEQSALEQAAGLVDRPTDELARPGITLDLDDPTRRAKAKKAEKRLQRALAEHDSAVQRAKRQDPALNDRLRRPLAIACGNLRLSEIDRLLATGDQTAAKNECERMATQWSAKDPMLVEVHQRVERIYAALAEQALAAGNFTRVRDLLEEVSARAPDPDAFGPALAKVRDELVARANRLKDEAKQLESSAPHQAIERLEQAAAIWPRLPGLEQARRAIQSDYPVLRCAYGEMPRTLCPFWVRTPVERHAVGLVCEGLVRWVDDEAGAHYVPQLSRWRPTPLARGRAFALPRCRWGGEDESPAASLPLTAEDIRATVELLKNQTMPSYSPVYGKLLDRVEEGERGDRFTARIFLKEDHWQPLSLMDFKVLPHQVLRAAAGAEALEQRLQEFGRAPIGTGPYRLAALDRDSEVRMRFVANPYYRVPGRPLIREVHLERHESTKAVEAFLQGKLEMIYGVQKEHVNQLVQQNRRVVTLPTPKICYLAPNYRRKLPANDNLRLAIAHAIDRNEILRQHFRAGQGERDHAPLNGPYPRRSWAANPKVEDFSASRAAGFASRAKDELKTDLTLQLLYPAGQEDVENACTAMQRHLQAVGITLNLEKAEPEKFRDRVLNFQDFDLVYWSYFYPDATFWIGPLVEPEPPQRMSRGWNVMNYMPDDVLEGLLRRIALHKCFRDIQDATHKIHEHFARKAVFIPLWQLDTYVAVGDRLRNADSLDPIALFTGIETWRLEDAR